MRCIMISSKHSFRFISRKDLKNLSRLKTTQHSEIKDAQRTSEDAEKESDNKKRTFLRVMGIAGASLVASQLLPKKAEALIMGSTPSSSVVGVKNSSNTRVDPSTETTLATRASETTLATRASETTLATRASEATLALIKAQADKFTFDGSNNLLTASAGGAASAVGIKDTTNTQVNPATDDSVQYLRRIVKLMESQAVVDSANRQRMTLDSLGTGTAITTTIPVSGTVTSTVTGATLAAGAAAIGSITAIDGQNHQMFQDFAKSAYASGIRQNLIFS
jgi:hypothetical protein